MLRNQIQQTYTYIARSLKVGAAIAIGLASLLGTGLIAYNPNSIPVNSAPVYSCPAGSTVSGTNCLAQICPDDTNPVAGNCTANSLGLGECNGRTGVTQVMFPYYQASFGGGLCTTKPEKVKMGSCQARGMWPTSVRVGTYPLTFLNATSFSNANPAPGIANNTWWWNPSVPENTVWSSTVSNTGSNNTPLPAPQTYNIGETYGAMIANDQWKPTNDVSGVTSGGGFYGDGITYGNNGDAYENVINNFSDDNLQNNMCVKFTITNVTCAQFTNQGACTTWKYDFKKLGKNRACPVGFGVFMRPTSTGHSIATFQSSQWDSSFNNDVANQGMTVTCLKYGTPVGGIKSIAYSTGYRPKTCDSFAGYITAYATDMNGGDQEATSLCIPGNDRPVAEVGTTTTTPATISSYTCPAGQYLSNPATDSCTPCTPGNYCLGGTGATQTPCPAGTSSIAGATSVAGCTSTELKLSNINNSYGCSTTAPFVAPTIEVNGPSYNKGRCVFPLSGNPSNVYTLNSPATANIATATGNSDSCSIDNKYQQLFYRKIKADQTTELNNSLDVPWGAYGTWNDNQLGGVGSVPDKTGFTLDAMADMNNDGKPDMIWKNYNLPANDPNGGKVVIWNMDKEKIITNSVVSFNAGDPNYKIVGAGDIDGDGKSDIVWANYVTNQIVVWYMDNSTLLSSGLVKLNATDTNTAILPDEWRIQAVSDMNNDGKAELIFREIAGAGRIVYWSLAQATINATTKNIYISSNTLLAATENIPDQGWQIQTAGDINNDGKSDIIWVYNQPGQTSTVVVWNMDNTTKLAGKAIEFFNQKLEPWRIAGLGDMDNDGKKDLTYRYYGEGFPALVCPNIPVTNGVNGNQIVKVNLGGQSADKGIVNLVSNVTGTEIKLANLTPGTCTTQVVGTATTCEYPLTGASNNTYTLPATPITVTVPGSTTSQPCTITGNGTTTAKLNCNNVPTTGSTVGTKAVPTSLGVTPTAVLVLTTTNTGTSSTLGLKVMLAGGYDSSTSMMKTSLKSKNLIPAMQSYNDTAFGYAGTESMTTIPTDAVDWVLVELRQGTTVVTKKAGILKADGNVIDVTSNSGIVFNNLPTGSYQVVVRHRNHLAIGTNTPITLTSGQATTLDFTTNANVKASNQALLKAGVYGLRLANTNSNNAINSSDRNISRQAADANNVYRVTDVNMDGIVNAQDRTIARLASEAIELI